MTVDTATAVLTGYFYTAHTAGAMFGAGSVRVSALAGASSVGSRILTPGMTQDGCVGSGETRFNVTNGSYFHLPLATLNNNSAIDHIQIDLDAYGCGADMVNSAVAMLTIMP